MRYMRIAWLWGILLGGALVLEARWLTTTLAAVTATATLVGAWVLYTVWRVWHDAVGLWQKGRPGWTRALVLLNGRFVEFCVRAHTLEGWVEVYKPAKARPRVPGSLVAVNLFELDARGEPRVFRQHGKVRVLLQWRKPDEAPDDPGPGPGGVRPGPKDAA